MDYVEYQCREISRYQTERADRDFATALFISISDRRERSLERVSYREREPAPAPSSSSSSSISSISSFFSSSSSSSSISSFFSSSASSASSSSTSTSSSPLASHTIGGNRRGSGRGSLGGRGRERGLGSRGGRGGRARVSSNGSNSPDHGRQSTGSASRPAAPVEDCVICLCPMLPSQKKARLQCLHVFHDKCLKPWKRRNNTCPVDRTNVTSVHVFK